MKRWQAPVEPVGPT